ncbi:ABC transporter ATP-binding protein [Qingshengfaniella alkalisoli]|uniref:ABC transporter ATP-binding protein n=1 Tax=Qingshengfaniella alkalisoli TaxID=2599296 RepID=A0A5B8I9P9_9RHOB|nr:ABC transporter ATP-binding protein [Qingshengfaniella alkalisoli]QDY70679.1 ABC transporter ATP-binding protein [Qingshengfaniella alkalisoli]
MSRDAILITEGLEKQFGGVVAARDISVAMYPGETLAVIGANGAGKTTFVNMVTGYLKPSAGTIRFRGRDITGMSPRDTARSGIRRSFQISQIFPQLTTLENVIIADIAAAESGGALSAPALTGERMDAARAILARFALDGFADSIVGTLPQGVKKQLDIAMAAVGDPAVILLDEPTSGVSVDEKIGMMETALAPLKDGETTLLFIEHDMDIVRRFAARTVAFYEGTILADGPTGEVLQNDKVRQYVIGGAHA